jgi:Uncharacterized protein SCO1/SenC/PrrC, involved in biogenesis of respiratory and photosynthetic systems
MACSSDEKELPYYHTADFLPLWAGEQKIKVDTLHTIPDFQFTDQDGNTVTNETFRNKIYVANFFFTLCPSVCPKMTSHLQKVANEFKDQPIVGFISHSVTPVIDSVSRLKTYAVENNIDSKQWHLITGEQNEIYTLARQSYFAEEEIGLTKQNEFLHTEHFVLIDQQGHIRGLYNGTLELEAMRLIDDIRILLSE